jgi:hypothetical protein
MTASLSNRPSPGPHRPTRRGPHAPSRPDRSSLRHAGKPQREPRSRRRLGGYVDDEGRPRELITRNGIAGSVLVLDRDAETLGDRRLVAHLGADEPAGNAAIVCRQYLEDTTGARGRCRALMPEDLRSALLGEEAPLDWRHAHRACAHELVDRHGRSHRLELVEAGMSIPELRWRRLSAAPSRAQSVSVREVVAALEHYEPVRSLTRGAVAQHGDDAAVSVTLLRAELERVLDSPIVLNRRLREAVLARVDRGALSMSEIAIRCGRVKRGSRGTQSGETSWLARRLGILPEGGHDAPTPWIHIDVLALISRSGLGIAPREVEV